MSKWIFATSIIVSTLACSRLEQSNPFGADDGGMGFGGLKSLVAQGDGTWRMEWDAAREPNVSYKVYSRVEENPYNFTNPIKITRKTSYETEVLTGAKTTCFIVRAATDAAEDNNTKERCVPADNFAPVFAGAQNLIQNNDGTVTLTWIRINNSNVTYNVYTKDSSDSFDFSTPITSTREGSWRASAPALGRVRCYAVRYAGSNLIEDTNTKEVCSPDETLIPFTGVTSAVSPSDGVVEVGWELSIHPGIREYRVYRDESFKTLAGTASATKNQLTLLRLVPGELYRFGVRAVDKWGREDANTATISVKVTCGLECNEPPEVPAQPVLSILPPRHSGGYVLCSTQYAEFDPDGDRVIPTFHFYNSKSADVPRKSVVGAPGSQSALYRLTTYQEAGTVAGADVRGDLMYCTVAVSDNYISVSSTASTVLGTDALGNAIPFLANLNQQTGAENTPLNFSLVPTDADGDTTQVSCVTNCPTGLVVNTATGEVNWTPTFEQAGQYTPTFRISDGIANKDASLTIVVNNVNRLPVFAEVLPQYMERDFLLSFAISATDADGQTITYSCKSSCPDGLAVNPNTAQVTWTATLAQVGSYTVIFAANDSEGETTLSVPITIRPYDYAPVLLEQESKTVDEGQLLTFTWTATDQDGDRLTYACIAQCPETLTVDSSSGVVNWTPGYEDAGVHDITFEVSDGQKTDSQILTVTVNHVNRAPTIATAGNASKTITEDLPANVTLAQGHEDDSGQTLTYVVVTSPTKGTLVAWPDTASAEGSTIIFSPTANQNGADSFSYKICDDDDPSLCTADVTVTITITPVNDAPAIVAAGVAALTIDEGDTTALALAQAADIDTGDELRYDLITAPALGTLETWPADAAMAGNVLIYTPTPQTFGVDTIVYRVCDNGEPQLCTPDQSVEVTVGVVNDPPEFTSIAAQTILEDTTLTDLTFTVSDIDSVVSCGLVEISSNNDTLLPPGSLIVGGEAGTECTLAILPAADQNGSALITLTLSDGGGPDGSQPAVGTMSFSLTLTAVNDAPTLLSQGELTKTTNEDTDTTITLAQGTDVDALDILRYVVLVPPQKGSLGELPTPASLADQTVTYSPDLNIYGEDAFTYRVCDNGSPNLCSADITVVVTIVGVNDTPTIAEAGDTAKTTDEDVAVSIALAKGADADITDNLVYEVVSAPSKGNFAAWPASAASSGNAIVYTPSLNLNGADEFTYRICDTGTPTLCTENIIVSITLTPVNDAPSISSIDDTVFWEDENPKTISFSVEDPETALTCGTPSVTVTSSNLALVPSAGLSLAGSTSECVLTLTPTSGALGTTTISLTATDGSLPTVVTFAVTVRVRPYIRCADAILPSGSEFDFPCGVYDPEDMTVTTSQSTERCSGVTLAGGRLTGTIGENSCSTQISIEATKAGRTFTFTQGVTLGVVRFATNGVVSAIATFPNGDVVVGGGFSTVNPEPAPYVTSLNATTGSRDTTCNLTQGFNGYVRAIAPMPDGTFVVGGSFTKYRGQTAKYIARLDCSGLMVPGFVTDTGFSAQVNALAVSGTDIYVGGDFTNYKGTSANRIAKLDASGNLIPAFNTGTGFNSSVRALATSGTDIYAGGYFTTYKGTSATRIAKLDASGNVDGVFDTGGGFSHNVNALAVSETDVYVGGSFTTYNGTSAAMIAKLNSSGNLVPEFSTGTGFNSDVNALAVSGTDIYVGGSFGTYKGTSARAIAKIDSSGNLVSDFNTGSSFDLEATSGNPVYAIAVNGSYVYVGGDFTSYNASGAKYIAKINSNGSLVPEFDTSSGLNSKVLAVAISDTRILIGGEFSAARGIPAGSIAKFNSGGNGLAAAFNTGSGFRTITNGDLIRAYVTALAISGSDIYAGGDFISYNDINTKNIAKISSNGNLVPEFNTGTGFSNYVFALATSGSDIYAGGNFTSYNGSSAVRLAKLDSSGNLVPEFKTGTGFSNYVYALATSGSDIYVGGYFATYNGTTVNNIVKLDSTGKSVPEFITGTGFNDRVYALTAKESNVYVGGSFTSYKGGSNNAKYIAKLDSGGNLANEDFGTGCYSSLSSLWANVAYVYGGGSFSSCNGVTANKIFRMATDGTGTISNVDPNAILSSTVVALSGFGSDVLAGGYSADTLYLSRIAANGSNASLWNLALASAVFDGEISNAEATANTDILLASTQSDYDAVAYALVAETTTDCSLAAFNKSSPPTTGDPDLSVGEDYRICARFSYGAEDIYRISYAFHRGTAPIISTIPTVGVPLAGASDTVTFTIADDDGSPSCDLITVTSSNSTLVPAENVTIAGTNGNCALTVTAPDGASAGSAHITITYTSGGQTISQTFEVRLSAPPILAEIVDQIAWNDETLALTVDFTLDDADSVVSCTQNVWAETTNQAVFPGSNIILSGTAPTCQATFTAVAGGYGATIARIYATDTITTTAATFTLTLRAAPTIYCENVKLPPGVAFEYPCSLTDPEEEMSIPAANATRCSGINLNAGVLSGTMKDACTIRLAFATSKQGRDFVISKDIALSPVKFSTNGTVNDIATFANGDVAFGGDFSRVDTKPAEYFTTVDIASGAMNCNLTEGFNGDVKAAVAMPDGTFVVGGNFTSYRGQPVGKIAKINCNGSMVSEFNNGVGFGSGEVTGLAASDGYIYAVGPFYSYNGTSCGRLAKIDSWGNLVSTFCQTFTTGFTYAVAISGTNVYIGGSFTDISGNSAGGIAKLTTNGNVIASFNTGSGFNSTVNTITISGSSLLVGGYFTDFNGIAANRIAKLTSNGDLDPTFASGTGANGEVKAIAESGSDIFIGGSFSQYNGNSTPGLVKVDSTGAWLSSFDTSQGPKTKTGSNCAVQALLVVGTDLFIGSNNCEKWGSNYSSFLMKTDVNSAGLVASFDIGGGFSHSVSSLALSGDNLLVGGSFRRIAGTPQNRIAKFNSSGTLLSNFATGTGFSSTVKALAASGSDLFVGGAFTSYNETSARYIAKLDASGNLVPEFNTGTGFNNYVYALALSGSNIYVGGGFSSYNDIYTNTIRIAKLDSGGNLVAGFNTGTGFSSTVYALTLSGSDIYVGGYFTSYNGTSAVKIAKLDASGNLVPGFNTGIGFNLPSYASVSALAVSDGHVYAGGGFTSYNGTSAGYIAKLDASGNLVPEFNTGIGFYSTVTALSENGGNVYVTGNFDSYQGTPVYYLTKLNPQGQIDTSFAPGYLFRTQTMKVVSFGTEVYVGGFFTSSTSGLAPLAIRLDALGNDSGSRLISLANGAEDGIISEADAAADLSVMSQPYADFGLEEYAVVTASTLTCTGDETYTFGTMPTAGAAEFVSGQWYKLCACFDFSGDLVCRLSNAFYRE